MISDNRFPTSASGAQPKAAVQYRLILRSLTAAFVLAAALPGTALLRSEGALPQPMLSWLLAACVVSCLAFCLWLLVGQLPVQNAAAICVIIGGLAWIESRLPWPAAALSRPEVPALVHAMIWISVILVARFMARLILSRSRGLGAYGIRVWLLATLLATQLSLGIATLQSAITEHEIHPMPSPLRIAHWAVTSLVMFICVSPWLIRKHPDPQAESSNPMLIWLAANILFVTAAIHLRLWVQASVFLAGAVLAAVLAERARPRAQQ